MLRGRRSTTWSCSRSTDCPRAGSGVFWAAGRAFFVARAVSDARVHRNRVISARQSVNRSTSPTGGSGSLSLLTKRCPRRGLALTTGRSDGYRRRHLAKHAASAHARSSRDPFIRDPAVSNGDPRSKPTDLVFTSCVRSGAMGPSSAGREADCHSIACGDHGRGPASQVGPSPRSRQPATERGHALQSPSVVTMQSAGPDPSGSTRCHVDHVAKSQPSAAVATR